ncbi:MULTISPECIES: CopG family transcriptional regulator [unclassified Rathayibacter]|uniref:CopG family transcriptional regulator n=1 Tax=unclassified Rathayibacter TaxID=2609250 RepID=UPI001044536F|nr:MULTISPECIES: CopG family transcriptional regulator [unclassified Rathayibacter]
MARTPRPTDAQDSSPTGPTEAQGIGKQEAAVRATLEAADRRAHRDNVAALSARGRARYAALLDRLAE